MENEYNSASIPSTNKEFLDHLTDFFRKLRIHQESSSEFLTQEYVRKTQATLINYGKNFFEYPEDIIIEKLVQADSNLLFYFVTYLEDSLLRIMTYQEDKRYIIGLSRELISIIGDKTHNIDTVYDEKKRKELLTHVILNSPFNTNIEHALKTKQFSKDQSYLMQLYDSDKEILIKIAFDRLRRIFLNGLEERFEPTHQDFSLTGVIFTRNQTFPRKEMEVFISSHADLYEFFYQIINESNDNFSLNSIGVLCQTRTLPIEVFQNLISDPDRSVRKFLLEILKTMRIDESNAPVFVQFFEDEDIDIFDSAVKLLNREYTLNPNAVVTQIISLLIVREDRSENFGFNKEVIAKVLGELFTLNVQLKSKTINTLYELSVSNYDNEIMHRCALVAKEIDLEEFKILVSGNYANSPAQKDAIMKLLDEGISLSSLSLNQNKIYVDHSRISEMKKIKNADFDLSKLILLCEELNKASNQDSYFSIAILVRSILDHIPPIFNKPSFAQVANNYSGGGRSLKDSFRNLENSCRKISDRYLHNHIRGKEGLPNRKQVDFSSDLDVLLEEIVRILKI